MRVGPQVPLSGGLYRRDGTEGGQRGELTPEGRVCGLRFLSGGPAARQVDPQRRITSVGRQPLLVPALMHTKLLPRPFHHDGWVYEEKVDGYRMAVYKDADGVRQPQQPRPFPPLP